MVECSKENGMPLIRNGTTNGQRVDALTQQLASELRSPKSAGEPAVYEDAIGQTKSFRVTVVWDEWKNLPLQTRSRIILDAYEEAAPEKNGKILVAMGLTRPEAFSMSVFPFSVIALLKNTDPPEIEKKVLAALRNEGAVEIGRELQLRFRTIEEAQQAYERLQNAVPGPHWAISQETTPTG